jgi:hypothetical protein
MASICKTNLVVCLRPIQRLLKQDFTETRYSTIVSPQIMIVPIEKRPIGVVVRQDVRGRKCEMRRRNASFEWPGTVFAQPFIDQKTRPVGSNNIELFEELSLRALHQRRTR